MEIARTPNTADLHALAEAGQFAAQFADLRACEIETGSRRKRLSPRQAWFVAWFGADERVREPKTLAAVAERLNVSRQVLYKWQAADWFNLTGVQAWERQFITSHIPNLYRKLIDNALNGDGAASNQAIKLALDIRDKQTGQAQPGGATAAVQVNINNIDVTKLNDEQLERIASGEDPVIVLATSGQN